MLVQTLFQSALFSAALHGAALNTTGVNLCEDQFYACVAAFGLQNFSNCTSPFETCMGTNAYLQPQKSQDCFLAESAWLNLKISTGFALSVFFFSNLFFPAMLKAGAKTITDMGSQEGYVGMLGKVLLYFTDSDGDGKTTAAEIVTPQTIFSFSSVAVPVYQWFSANDQQAKCDYQKSLPPAAPAS